MTNSGTLQRLRNRRVAGVTLIELMIVVVIVGILAAIGYPNYRQYVLRSNRTEARAFITDLAARQERFFADCNGYSTNPVGVSGACLAANGLGAGVTSATGLYLLTNPIPAGATANIRTSFLLTVTAQGAQTADAACLTFTLDNRGVRGGTSPICWP